MMRKVWASLLDMSIIPNLGFSSLAECHSYQNAKKYLISISLCVMNLRNGFHCLNRITEINQRFDYIPINWDALI